MVVTPGRFAFSARKAEPAAADFLQLRRLVLLPLLVDLLLQRREQGSHLVVVQLRLGAGAAVGEALLEGAAADVDTGHVAAELVAERIARLRRFVGEGRWVGAEADGGEQGEH